MTIRLSYSQLSSLTTCGEQFRLERVIGVTQRPAWALIGGSTVHEMTEHHDLAEHGVSVPSHTFAEVFERRTLEAEEASGMERSEFRASGRASSRWPNKEDASWWLHEGPAMVQRWVSWTTATPWNLWITPDGKPAVEIEFDMLLNDDDIDVKGFIDRVYEYQGYLIVLDIKGLAVDTPLATPSGWTTIGEIGIGDEVFGPDGKPTKVTAKSAVKNLGCYRVTFDDATSITCDEEHLWETWAGPRATDRAVRSISEIADTIKKYGQNHHRIPVADPLVTPPAQLPIHPYVLGAWLGDGKHTSGEFTTAAEDSWLPSRIAELGYRVTQHKSRSETVHNWNINGILPALRELGLYGNKHVPSAYLRGSIDQRLDLLRGLMDSDGTVNRARNDRVAFAVVDPALADAVHELATSLGERAKCSHHAGHGFGKDVTVHVVEWKPARFNPFLMPRKAELVDLSRASARAKRRIITSVEKIESVPTQCIAVDNDSHLYLAGREMIATHNTGSRPQPTPRQLGTYKVGLEQVYGKDIPQIAYGTFWDARKGATSTPAPLNEYDERRLGYQYGVAAKMRRENLYLPSPGPMCSGCSVNEFCFEYTQGASAAVRPPWVSVEEWEGDGDAS